MIVLIVLGTALVTFGIVGVSCISMSLFSLKQLEKERERERESKNRLINK